MEESLPQVPLRTQTCSGGFAAEVRDDAEGLRQVLRRIEKSPLGSAAGYGTPGLPIDRAATAAALGFAVQEPVTSVQLSRGKADSTSRQARAPTAPLSPLRP